MTFKILYVFPVLSHSRREVIHYNVTDSPSSAWTARQLIRISPHSPWQNPYVERLIGSIRWECLDHVIILGERHLRKVLKEYFRYYTESRTHLGLGKEGPKPRAVDPPEMGKVVATPQVGGLHHRYTRVAA